MGQINVNTVLFDFDGTLADTNELIIESFKATMGNYFPDKEYNREDLIEFIGPTLVQTFSSMLPDRYEEMIDFYTNHNREIHDDMINVYEGIVEGLDALKSRGIKLGIVSSKKRKMLKRGLKVLNLLDYFEIIVGAEDVKNPKPHQEPILLGMKLIKSTKEETIFVGDNRHDIEAGKNAGVVTCGVAWALRGAIYLKKHSPDYILNSLEEIVDIIDEVNNNG